MISRDESATFNFMCTIEVFPSIDSCEINQVECGQAVYMLRFKTPQIFPDHSIYINEKGQAYSAEGDVKLPNFILKQISETFAQHAQESIERYNRHRTSLRKKETIDRFEAVKKEYNELLNDPIIKNYEKS